MVLDLLKQANKVGVGADFELVKEGLYLIVGRFGGSRSRDGVGLIHAFDASNKQHFHGVAYIVGRRLARRIIGRRGGGFKVWARAGLKRAGGSSNSFLGEIINSKEAAGPGEWAKPPLFSDRHKHALQVH